MASFKALLVLRMALGAKHQPEVFRQLLQLDVHRKDHMIHKPNFAVDAERVAIWIKNHLEKNELDAISSVLSSLPPSLSNTFDTIDAHKSIVTTLQNFFFAININGMYRAQIFNFFKHFSSRFTKSYLYIIFCLHKSTL